MNKQCVNCPGAVDHTTAECPAMCEASAPIDPIHSAMMLGMTPEPCEPVIEITRQAVTKLLDVVEFGDQLERVEKDRLVAFVKELLAQEQPELWAMHSVGPNEVHPMISKEEAEKQAASLIALCKDRFPEIPITVNVIPSPYSPFEHFEILAEELTEQVASLREALDKKNAEAAAPAVVNQQVTTAAQPSAIFGKYSNVLRPFMAMMEAELHANTGKGDRPGWLAMSPEQCLLEIYYHTAKLQKAVKNNDMKGVREHTADVANMSMMLADTCGWLDVVSSELAANEEKSMAELIRQHRIAVTPEHEGQWHADLYGSEAEPLARAEGATPEAAVAAVVALYLPLQEQQP